MKKVSNPQNIISNLLNKKSVRTSGLKLWHWNANSYSLHKKFELQNLVQENNNMFDLLSISETHFKPYHDFRPF